MKTTALLCLSVFACFAQGPSVNQVSGPPPAAYVQQAFYDGSSNLIYSCLTHQLLQLASTVKRSDSSLTSIVVSANVGTVTTANPHGLWVGAIVTASGSTTSALNAVYKIATVPSTTTYTIATSGVGDATYNNAALVISTNNPLFTQGVWAIQVFVYDGSNRFDHSYWANNGVGEVLACSNRANY
jgi:hypothetical protein